MSIQIGPITTRNTVFLAPMSGVTDLPFRKLAHRFGAGLVVSEMVASEDLVRRREDVVQRAAGADHISPLVVQLVGREPNWMAEGAKLAEADGADIIDINMGCPSRQVTTGFSGSALMRDLDFAVEIIDAVVDAVSIPVTLKMRLGWDDDTINAPELARRAELSGVQMVTVHGRTRNQFYKGTANWGAISHVKEEVSVPVIANGDAATAGQAKRMRDEANVDGVMIGRGAYGRPWLLGEIALSFEENGCPRPALSELSTIVQEHYDEMLSHYGVELGVRCARKHLGWYLQTMDDYGWAERLDIKAWRAKLCREEDPQKVKAGISEFFAEALTQEAA
ncbi:MAG: tRNA dihydrouridine synthase DusB [Hyphomicrobiales bacterium]